MKRLTTSMLLALVAVQTASAAFDAEAWLAKRRRLTAEALRLREAYTNCIAGVEAPAENVTVSLETFPDGTVKTSVSAQRAQFFLDTGLVWAEGVVLRKFKKDGVLDARIDAENCVIDRNAKAGWSEGEAKVVQGSTAFRGKRVYFSSREGYVKVFRDTDMESHDLQAGGLRR